MKKILIAILCILCFSIYGSEGYFEKVTESASFLKEKTGANPKLLIVLTAGIHGPLDLLEDPIEISSADIPHFPVARAQGHEGKLIFGKLDGIEIVLMKGRYHYYEGITPQEVVFPYFVLGEMGIQSVITMNAVGGIRHDLNAGDIVLLTDHINLLGENPLRGLSIQFPERQFTDMTEPYDSEYRQIAKSEASLRGLELKTGVYTAVSGPSYETRSEIRLMRTLGADFVGMSTLFEVIACRFQELRVLAFSCVTNPAADRHEGGMTHEEVLEALEEMAPRLSDLVTGCAREILAQG